MDGYTYYMGPYEGHTQCNTCGLLVSDKTLHTAWHQALDKRATWQPFGGPL